MASRSAHRVGQKPLTPIQPTKMSICWCRICRSLDDVIVIHHQGSVCQQQTYKYNSMDLDANPQALVPLSLG
jgi:hypothetical protein